MGKNYKKNDIFSLLTVIGAISLGLGCDSMIYSGESVSSKEELVFRRSEQTAADEKAERAEKGITLYQRLPQVLQEEVAKAYITRNALKIAQDDYIGYTIEHLPKRDDVYCIDAYGFCITRNFDQESRKHYLCCSKLCCTSPQYGPAQLSMGSLNYEIPGISKEHAHFSVIQNNKHALILTEGKHFYVFQPSQSGPTFNYTIKAKANVYYTDNVSIAMGDIKMRRYFVASTNKKTIALFEMDQKTNDQRMLWEKTVPEYLPHNKEYVSDSFRIISCNRDMSRLAVEVLFGTESMAKEGVSEQIRIFYVIDGLTGKIIKEYVSSSKPEPIMCRTAESNRDYCVVYSDGQVNHYDENQELIQSTTVQLGSDFDIDTATISDDLTRVLWDGTYENESDNTYLLSDIECGITAKVDMPVHFRSNSFGGIPFVYNSPMTVAMTAFPRVGARSQQSFSAVYPIDNSIVNLKPLTALFLKDFRDALALVKDTRARVARQIGEHSASSKNRGKYDYYPSRARIIIKEGTDLYQQFLKLPPWLQATLQHNYSDLFRIYPADHPHYYLKNVEDTPLYKLKSQQEKAPRSKKRKEF